MRKLLFTLVAFVICAATQTASAYQGKTHTVTQPDGTKVKVYLYGNEMYMDAESADHYTLIIDDKTGYVSYAKLSADGNEYVSSGIRYDGGETPATVKNTIKPRLRINKARREEIARQRREKTGQSEDTTTLRAGTTLPDTIIGLCVMVDFPDRKFKFTAAEVDTFLNGDTETVYGNSMSVKQYFQWISSGKLTYINLLPKRIFRAPHPFEYYSASDATSYTPELLMEEVVNAVLNVINVEDDGFDLNALTRGENGFLAINILYAGESPEKWATGLWPHKGGYKFDLRQYGLNPEKYQIYQISNTGKDSLGLGTFVHENCHMLLNFPDFYSFEETNDDNNAATYNIGDSFGTADEHNPDYPNPYSLDLLGWLPNRQDITNANGGKTITLKKGVGNAAVYYGEGNNSAERYYLEIRDHHHYDHQHRDDKGVFIWHVNANGNNNYSGYEELLDCRAATLENCMWSKDNGPSAFEDDSEPSAKWVDGTKSGLYLWDFSEVGETMTFKVGRTEEKPLEIVTTALAMGEATKEYMSVVRAEGGDFNYTFFDTSGTLPTGLDITAEGLIVGTPLEMFDDTVIVHVYDGAGNIASKKLYLYIDEAEKEIEAEYGYTLTFYKGANYAKWIEVSGGYDNFSFALKEGELPPGITLREDGLLSGKVEVADTFSVVVEITSQGKTHTVRKDIHLKFVVKDPESEKDPNDKPLTVVPRNIETVVGEEISDTITITSDGFGNLTFTVDTARSEMPEGVSISEDGKITGAAKEAGRYIVYVTVKSMKSNGAGKYVTFGFYIIVKERPKDETKVRTTPKTQGIVIAQDEKGDGFVIKGARKGSLCTVVSIIGAKVEEFKTDEETTCFGKGLSKGMYLVKIKDEEGMKVVKVMKR